MKKLFILCFLLINFNVYSQSNLTPYVVYNIGYDYWKGSFGKLGADLYLVQQNNNIFTVSANANLGYMQDKFRVIPEVGVGYLFNFKNNTLDLYSSNVSSSFYSARVDVSPWTITPKLGVAILSVFEINAGYSFEFNEREDFKSLDGFRAGFVFHLPSQLF